VAVCVAGYEGEYDLDASAHDPGLAAVPASAVASRGAVTRVRPSRVIAPPTTMPMRFLRGCGRACRGGVIEILS
jgi:hypothetical protein